LKKLFGLIGFPLGHSRSADYFNNRFRSAGLTEYEYRLFPIPVLNELHHLLKEHPELCGLNVTIPFKEKIIPLLTSIDDLASEIGSVNVVRIRREDGTLRMIGYNTDAGGFLATIEGKEHHAKALVLGTGGAAKAVAYALRKTGAEVTFVSRNPAGPGTTTYKKLWENPGIVRDHTLIVNATPAGMFPHTDSFPSVPYEQLNESHLLYDLVYNPEQTLFLQKGADHGARTLTGEEMFLRQADLSYAIFTR